MSNTALKMKELEARTGVGREAIRFYIREGMLPEPEKPKRNVAFYGDAHVKRLLAIRQLKEERQMSLASIKSVLDSAEFDSLVETESLAGLERLLPALVDGVAPAPDRLFDDVVADGDLDEAEIISICELGIVTPIERGGVRWIDFRDAAIIRKWGQSRRAGFTQARGYDLSTLKRYRALMEELAEIEVSQFFEAFAGVGAEEAAGAAAQAIEGTNDILIQLRTKALLARVNQRLEADDTVGV